MCVPSVQLYTSSNRFFAIFRNFSAWMSTSSLRLSWILFFANLSQMTHFISRIFFLEFGFSLNVPKASKLREGTSPIPPSYLLHHILRFHLHVVISFWRGCMAYSKHCLNDKQIYHFNFWIEFLLEPNCIFFGTLKYCLSSISCSNWCYPFFIFLTYYT